jgi:hypothetical protein
MPNKRSELDLPFPQLIPGPDQTAYERGFAVVYEKGFADGSRAERRKAKGKSPIAKPHGGQKLLENDIWALQFFDFVNQCTANDAISVAAAVADYLRVFRRGLKREGITEGDAIAPRILTYEPTKARESLIHLYRRMKKGTHKIEPRIREQYEALNPALSDT